LAAALEMERTGSAELHPPSVLTDDEPNDAQRTKNGGLTRTDPPVNAEDDDGASIISDEAGIASPDAIVRRGPGRALQAISTKRSDRDPRLGMGPAGSREAGPSNCELVEGDVPSPTWFERANTGSFGDRRRAPRVRCRLARRAVAGGEPRLAPALRRDRSAGAGFADRDRRADWRGDYRGGGD
jgi:hypothetical protein